VATATRVSRRVLIISQILQANRACDTEKLPSPVVLPG
jgi:hypothetical protein